MRMIGNDVYIQRGENWSLDFAVTDDKGHPFCVLKNWQNPYLAITVTAALYEQRGDFRETYWLDVDKYYAEQTDGSMKLVDRKRFTSAEPLYLPNGFNVADALDYYGVDAGGKIVLDHTDEFDITNFLFYADPDSDGNNQYKYIKDYMLDGNGDIALDDDGYERVTWEEYDFRVVKQFNTKSWMEQRYLYDIKLLAGESVQERLMSVLDTQRTPYKHKTLWTNEDWDNYINAVWDEPTREEMRQYYEDGAPLLPTYDTKSLLLDPTPIYVSVNIQGGVR